HDALPILVYNTDQDCIHYYDGTSWINICEALDNTFTVSTRADFLRLTDPNAIDSTVVVTSSEVDGIPNLNFEVNVINSSNIGQSAVTNSKIQNGSSRSEEHTSELQSRENLVCRLLLEKKNQIKLIIPIN